MKPSRKITAQNGKAYSYIRCSTPGQSKEGRTSILRQSTGAEDYCAKHGLTLMSEGYEDIGVSAFRGKNANDEESKLFSLIAAIKAGGIPRGSTLIIENLDRLSRDVVTESLPLFMQLLNDDIYVVTLSDNRVWSKESIRKNGNDLLLSIFELSRSHEESVRKSDLIGKAWTIAQKNAAQKKIKQNYPKWLELRDNKFTVIPDRAKVIKDIFKQYLAGKGTGSIARDLNTRGIGTFTGKAWNQTLVKHYLKFPAVHGEWRAGKRDEDGRKVAGDVEPIPDYYPAIITKPDFNRVRARMSIHKPKYGRPQRPDANLFQGIIKCGYCGSSMGIYNAKESSSFICWNSLAGHCVRVAFEAEAIELEVLGSLYTVMQDWAASKTDTQRVQELQGEIVELDGKISNLVKVIEAGGDLAPVIDRLKTLKAEREVLNATLGQQQALNETATTPGLFQNWVRNLFHSPEKNNTDDRIAIMPHIKRHVECIRVYPVGEKGKDDEYKKRLKEYADAGRNGSQCYHALRKEFNVYRYRYFTIELKNPIKVDGQMTTFVTPKKWPNVLQSSPKGGLETHIIQNLPCT